MDSYFIWNWKQKASKPYVVNVRMTCNEPAPPPKPYCNQQPTFFRNLIHLPTDSSLTSPNNAAHYT